MLGDEGCRPILATMQKLSAIARYSMPRKVCSAVLDVGLVQTIVREKTRKAMELSFVAFDTFVQTRKEHLTIYVSVN